MWLLVFQRIFFDALIDLFYFPLWWYTGGVFHSLKWCFGFFLEGNEKLAPGLWFKNLLVPMYGQYDWQGRIISFFMRFVQFCLRSLALLVWFIFCVLLFVVWLALPIFLITILINSFGK